MVVRKTRFFTSSVYAKLIQWRHNNNPELIFEIAFVDLAQIISCFALLNRWTVGIKLYNMSQHWLRNFINKRQIFLSSFRRFLFQLIPLGERPRATFLRAFILDAELYFSIHYTQSEASFHFLQMYVYIKLLQNLHTHC